MFREVDTHRCLCVRPGTANRNAKGLYPGETKMLNSGLCTGVSDASQNAGVHQAVFYPFTIY
jgi:hypothetical protein